MASSVDIFADEHRRRQIKAALETCGVLAIVLSLAAFVLAKNTPGHLPYQPLVLTAAIPLPGVHGRFDHFAFDPAEPGRLFLAALAHDSLEVINLTGGTTVHTISGLGHPQGVGFASGLKKIFVAPRHPQNLYTYTVFLY